MPRPIHSILGQSPVGPGALDQQSAQAAAGEAAYREMYMTRPWGLPWHVQAVALLLLPLLLALALARLVLFCLVNAVYILMPERRRRAVFGCEGFQRVLLLITVGVVLRLPPAPSAAAATRRLVVMNHHGIYDILLFGFFRRIGVDRILVSYPPAFYARLRRWVFLFDHDVDMVPVSRPRATASACIQGTTAAFPEGSGKKARVVSSFHPGLFRSFEHVCPYAVSFDFALPLVDGHGVDLPWHKTASFLLLLMTPWTTLTVRELAPMHIGPGGGRDAAQACRDAIAQAAGYPTRELLITQRAFDACMAASAPEKAPRRERRRRGVRNGLGVAVYLGSCAAVIAGVLAVCRQDLIALPWIPVAVMALALLVSRLIAWAWPSARHPEPDGATLRHIPFAVAVHGLNYLVARPLVLLAAWWIGSLIPAYPSQFLGTLPDLVLIPTCLVFYEGVGYLYHRLAHRIPLLWQVAHSPHHETRHFGVFLALRAHHLEIFIIQLVRVCPLSVLQVDQAIIVAVISIVLWAGTLQHTATDLRFGLLNYLILTPEAHFWHHDTELRVNYGSGILTVFDHLGGTFCYRPGQQPSRLGILDVRERSFSELWACRPLRTGESPPLGRPS